MTFEIVKVRAHRVGGLVVPGVQPGVYASSADLMNFTADRLRERGLRDLTVVFVQHPEVGWSAVVGYRCDNLDDLAVGDSLIVVSEKYAARFVPEGETPTPHEDLWEQVHEAERDGRLGRSFTEEVLVLPENGEPELFIALK